MVSTHLRTKATTFSTLQRACLVLTLLSAQLASTGTQAQATTVPPAAVALYHAGLAAKSSNKALALQDFTRASHLAPDWEPPLYEEGALLAVSDFSKAVPVLLKAAKVAPHDDTVWNILGWGYYQQREYPQAEASFVRQLSIAPSSGPGLWGLANCYANSSVRAFAKARINLTLLQKQPTYRALALKLLANLQPNAVDPSYHAAAPITYEDAIAMILSWRSDTLHYPSSTVVAADHKPARADVTSYIAWANAHNWFTSVTIPSFQAPATRLGLSLLLAKAYGLNQYDYLRPFTLTDMTSVPIDEQMTVNSVLANRLLTVSSSHTFSPAGTMSRRAFAAVVAHANAVMVSPPPVNQLLTAPQPAKSPSPVLYLFSSGQPDTLSQTTDFTQHAKAITAIGLTYYPFITDFPAGSAFNREKIDHTQFLLTANSASPAVAAELTQIKAAGIGAFMVLANYNNITDKADPVVVDHMLRSPSKRQKLITEIVGIVQKEQLAGVTADFEDMEASDRGNYVLFMQELHSALTAIGKKTMVCLPERYQSSGGASAYDYSKLGKSADWVMLITYDEHIPGGLPGAIATLSNTQRVIQFAVQQIQPAKLLLGAADYGYDWSNGTGVEVSMAQAKAIAASHGAHIVMDAASDSPTFTYTSAGVKHTVWFENGASLHAVASLVKVYGLGGMAVWHLGADNAEFWQAVATQ